MKKALCIGVSYEHSNESVVKLSQTHHDAYKIRTLLMDVYGYTEVKFLIDGPEYQGLRSDGRPTRNGILKAFEELVKGAAAHDRLVVHFSGHGSQRPENRMRNVVPEEDSLDELIWPADIELVGDDERNAIVDNEIHDILVHLHNEAHLTIIFDCCHSGTAADLPFNVSPQPRGGFKVPKRQSGKEPKVISLSACKDSQSTPEFDYTGGLFVKCLYDILHERTKGQEILTYNLFISKLREKLKTLCLKLSQAQRPDGQQIPIVEFIRANGPLLPVCSTSDCYDLDLPFQL